MNDKIKIPGGLFVALEGIDGTGKTTLTSMLDKSLSRFLDVLITKEPSDTVYGRKLRIAFEEGRLSPEEELELFVKDREEHIKNIVIPNLKQNRIVITDRYFFSNIAYQGAYGVDIESIKKANSHFPLPDIVIFLYLDVDTALNRIGDKRGNTNIVEKKENILKVKNIYSALEKEYKNIFKRVESYSEIEEVHEKSLNIIRQELLNKITDEDTLKKISSL